jgi:hypothetical protein
MENLAFDLNLAIYHLELVSSCSYCTMVTVNPHYKTPVYCTKYSGSISPILVNVPACLSCGEYKKTSI